MTSIDPRAYRAVSRGFVSTHFVLLSQAIARQAYERTPLGIEVSESAGRVFPGLVTAAWQVVLYLHGGPILGMEIRETAGNGLNLSLQLAVLDRNDPDPKYPRELVFNVALETGLSAAETAGLARTPRVDWSNLPRVVRQAVGTVLLHEVDEGLIVDRVRAFDPHRSDAAAAGTSIWAALERVPKAGGIG